MNGVNELRSNLTREEVYNMILQSPILYNCMVISTKIGLSFEEMLILFVTELYKNNKNLEEMLINQEMNSTRFRMLKDWS